MNSAAEIAPRVRSERLPNGVRAYLLENHANATLDLVGLFEGGMWIEDASQAGLANLTVEMLDRGTHRRSQTEIAELLESNGAQLRYGLTPEAVLVRGRCLSEDLVLLMMLLGETLREPSFPEDQLRLVREDALVGLREAAFDTHDRALRRAAELRLGVDHPYARHTLGAADCIAALRRQDLEGYHAQAVGGARLSLAIVGDIDPDQVTRLLEEHLGPLPAGDPGVLEAARHSSSSHLPAETPAGGLAPETLAAPASVDRRYEHIEIPDRGQVDLLFLRPGVARRAPDFEAYGLANFLLGGSFISRLNRQLRDREGLTYGAHSVIVSGREPGIWYATIGVDPRNVTRAMEGVQREIQALATGGVGEEELEMARQHLTGSFPIRLEANSVVASALLDGVRSDRGLDYVDRYCERIRTILPEQVNGAARRLFATDDVVTVSAGTLA